MKKVASIIATALITCSLSACGNRNTAYRTPGIDQGRANINIDQRNNVGVDTAAFKDGVYLGEGNKTSQENHAAIVTVRNGRITNVVLKTLDSQGKEITTRSSSNFNIADINNTTIGGTTGIDATRGTTPGITPPGPRTNNIANDTTNNNITNNNTTNNITNNTANTALTHSERVRQDLANAIVSQQTNNVAISNVGNETFAVDNWKLAVSRALVGAKR